MPRLHHPTSDSKRKHEEVDQTVTTALRCIIHPATGDPFPVDLRADATVADAKLEITRCRGDPAHLLQLFSKQRPDSALKGNLRLRDVFEVGSSGGDLYLLIVPAFGSMLVFGGKDRVGENFQLEHNNHVYKLTGVVGNCAVSNLPDLPQIASEGQIARIMAAILNNTVMVFSYAYGHADAYGVHPPLQKCPGLELVDNKWVALPAVPIPASNVDEGLEGLEPVKAMAYKGRLLLCFVSKPRVRGRMEVNIQQYDATERSWSELTACTVGSCSRLFDAVILEDKLVMLFQFGSTILTAAKCCDLDACEWSNVPLPPADLNWFMRDASCAVLRGKLVITGGCSSSVGVSNSASARVLQYDPHRSGEAAWSALLSMPHGMCQHATIACDDGKLLVIDGQRVATGPGRRALGDTLFLFDADASLWSELSERLPDACRKVGACILPWDG